MSGPSPRRVEIAAPAKLNLGLEVLGRRDDGYHEIATVFLAVGVLDVLVLSADDELDLRSNGAELSVPDNLILRALDALRTEASVQGGAHVALQKRIPIAAGLGGASSDAAAALLAGRELWRLPVSDETLGAIAAGLGSDVPFFLRGGCALGRGRGETLEPLPVPHNLWFVIVAPEVVIPRKTAALYARLIPADFSDGQRVNEQARRIAAGLPPDPALLGNAFSRPLYDLAPRISRLPAIMRDAGADVVAISGAGPSHFAPFIDGSRASAVADRLRRELGDSAQVFVAKAEAERSFPSRPL